MQILALSGSLRAGSTTALVLRATAALAPANAQFTFYEGLADLPHFSPELDISPPPAAVAHLRSLLQAADGVLICTPEYAFGVPGSFKNALDWIVSSGSFFNKPVAVLSASPTYTGAERAHASLLLTLTALGAIILEEGKLIIPGIRTKMTAAGELTDANLKQALQEVIKALEVAVVTPNSFP